MPKERSINPAQEARKADKAKALKKSKAEKHTRQNEKLARRNPERLQRQIDELKELESSGQGLRPKDKQTLEQLEKDVKAVKRARETLGERATAFGQARRGEGERNGGGSGGNNLGKRRRDEQAPYGRGGRRDVEESETDDEVRDIPMPLDTPPPIPRRHPRDRNLHSKTTETLSTDPAVVLPPARPVVPSKTVYSSAPVLRDLAQESKRFVPAAVAQNFARKKGQGGRLLEPEELDKLEYAGYGDAAGAAEEATKEAAFKMMNAEVQAQAQGDEFDIDEEARHFERELKRVEMEEVPDEDL